MIHQYKLNGYNIVLDVYSGSIHVVDEVAYDIIELYEKNSKEEITKIICDRYNNITAKDVEECLEDVEYLKENKQLYTEDIYKGLKPKLKSNSVVKALCLHVAHTCNLACEYCFAKQGTYHGKDAMMTLEVGKKAIDFLIEHSGARKNLEVDFFGGEPLVNWRVVKEVVKYARSIEKEHNKNFRFTLTTNGVLINDEVIDFSNKEMHNVVLSLDGRKETNDRFRVNIKGEGSYNTIVPKFQKLVAQRGDKDYYIRGTFTRNNLDFSNDVLHFADLGFEQISIEPVVGEDTDPYAIRKEDLPKIFEEYDKLAKIMVERERSGRGFTFFHFMIDLEGGPCVSKRLSGCGSGTEYLAVTPWGDLYPCHQFVGQEEFLMGNVDEGITHTEIADEFRGCSVYSKESCKNCFARFYCSGGCMANSYKFNHSINDTYEVSCEMERKRVECAIMIKAALADADAQ